jgi:hypothetical protein
MEKLTAQEILNAYPKIFKEMELPMTESCMYWGLEVPESWLPIIDTLCYCMENYTYTNSSCKVFPQVVAEQVKDKFNGLRFYYKLEYAEDIEVTNEVRREHTKYIDGMICMAELMINNLEENGNPLTNE